MARKSAAPQEIELVGNIIRKSHLLRMAGFADRVDRFIDIYLKDEVNWLKTFAVTLLISRGGTLTPSELGRLMLRSNENMTKLVDSLAQDGLVKRSRRGKDRRTIQLRITPDGLSFMTKTLESIKKAERSIESSMDAAELVKLETFTETLGSWLREQTRHGSPDTIA